MRTREQEYAIEVFNRVTGAKQREEAITKSYSSMAHNLPVLVRTAGLIQALTFLETRDDQGQKQLLKDLAEVVFHDRTDITGSKRDYLLKRSREAKLPEYMQLTQKTLDALLWFKRYAESMLDPK